MTSPKEIAEFNFNMYCLRQDARFKYHDLIAPTPNFPGNAKLAIALGDRRGIFAKFKCTECQSKIEIYLQAGFRETSRHKFGALKSP